MRQNRTMKTSQMRWTDDSGWKVSSGKPMGGKDCQLVLVFASPDCLGGSALNELREHFPNARIVGGSSAGNVMDTTCSVNDIVATAVTFAESRVATRLVEIPPDGNTFDLVNQAAKGLLSDDLKHILVLSDGLNINGSELARAVNIGNDVSVTGGLMGDNGRFEETFVIADGEAFSNAVVLIGFYGDKLKIGHGCYAGWDEFGINRKITKSNHNVVYEIDGEPALKLYKKYLGDFGGDLPASGLRFPLSITEKDGVRLIRTLLGVDEEAQSLTFAGDVPEGATTLLMKGNIENLIDGAGTAAKQAYIESGSNGLAVVISCVGRRMLMDQLVEEELDAVKDALGGKVTQTGFYSYGELAPHSNDAVQCQLHNQTMTLFTLYE